jgi:peptidoglycan/LPS O-acetylase OafA/YrhL
MGSTPVPNVISSDEGTQFFPGLEGLRGLAVVAVLFFHGGFDWAKGGFLGVSTFFTLSGFLITSNLLRQVEGSSQVRLREFWLHRFRRLLPAAMAAILLAAVYTALAGEPTQRHNFASDSASALAYIANWRFIFSGQSYSDLFVQPSALLHFWSLAIEEQFYLLFPLLCVGLLVRAKLGRRGFAGVLLLLIGGSLACALLLGLSQNAIYLGTATRAGEILMGALLATVLTPRWVRSLVAKRTSVTDGFSVAGLVAVCLAVIAWGTVSENDSWLYRGGFLLFSLLSVLLILGSITLGSPLRWLLSSAPFRRIGLVSYGIYLYHWPIFLWLSPRNTGLSDAVLFAPRAIISVALAAISFRYLERPVKSGRTLPGVSARVLVVMGTAVVIVVSLAITLVAPPLSSGVDAAAKNFAEVTAGVQRKAGVPLMAMFGDSTALAIGTGLVKTGLVRGTYTGVGGAPKAGCGLVYELEIIDPFSRKAITPTSCDWHTLWSPFFATDKADLCVVTYGPLDSGKHRPAGTEDWLYSGVPSYDKVLEAEVLAATDFLNQKGCLVVWILSVPIENALGISKTPKDIPPGPDRQRRLNDIVTEAVKKRPTIAGVVDFAGWYTSRKHNDGVLRPDGTHFTTDTAQQMSDAWLSDAVIAEYRAIGTGSGS